MSKPIKKNLWNHEVRRVKMEPFSKEDWYAWSGAVIPDDGYPHIGYAVCEDWPEDLSCCNGNKTVTIIVDRNGIEISGLDGFSILECSFKLAKKIAEKLPRRFKVEELAIYGFKKIENVGAEDVSLVNL